MAFNKFFFNGELVDIDFRDSGNAMIWIKTSKHPEVEIKQSQIPSWYCSIIPIRISKMTFKNLVEHYKKNNKDKKVDPNKILVIGEKYNIEGSIQGVKRMVDGKAFYTAEVQAARIIKDE